MTEAYRKILAAVDLSDDSHAVVARALALAGAQAAQLILLHVVKVQGKTPGAVAAPLTEELETSARERFDALSERFRLAQARQLVRVGALRDEIVKVALEEQVDLILLGSRERHGLSMILHLTEDTVLHAAPCDVLVVRLTSP